MATGLNVLIVEDNPADAHLIHQALKISGLKYEFRHARNGEAAVIFLDSVDGGLPSICPALLILDLNLPKIRGVDVLRHMRGSGRCQNTIVIIVSSSDSRKEKDEVFKLGANAYFRKPSSYDEFMTLGDLVKSHFPAANTA